MKSQSDNIPNRQFNYTYFHYIDDEIPVAETDVMNYINLTTHAEQFGSNPIALDWGNPDPLKRGPVIATVR